MKNIASILVISCMVMPGVVQAQAHASRTITGYISDSKCGAMHMDNGVGCVKQCIENGNQPVLVDFHKKVWAVDNPLALKGYYGDNVRIVALVSPDEKSIHVSHITKLSGVMGGMKDGVTR